MEYAGRRFAENGYHPTSVAEIVQGIGVGKGVFYWYFSSKEELFSEILREAQQELRRRQQAAIGDEADPVRRIELGIRASMDWLSENRHLFTLLQFAVSDEQFSQAVVRGRDVAVADVVRHVKEGVVSGRVSAWMASAAVCATPETTMSRCPPRTCTSSSVNIR